MRRPPRHALLLSSALSALCLLAVSAACTTPSDNTGHGEGTSRPPNLVYIMADDLGWADLGSYGQAQIETPRLDRMAAEGTRFTQYYAGSTVCAPSRATLMTGRHTGHAWIRGNGEFPIRPEDVTVAEVLREAAALESGDMPGEHPPLYWEFHERGFEQAVRMGRWKAVRHGVDQPLELYDLEIDVSEDADVADEHPEVVARIEEYLKTARTESSLWPVEE